MRKRSLSSGESYANDLTWREQEILTLLAERLTNREIAEYLHLAESTVKDYVGNILSKLYVRNRREAVECAKSLGLLDDDQKTKIEPPSNLPTESTKFVGRKNELEEVEHSLKETRLLTLTGPGGIGKTRLALKTADEMAHNYKDGVFLVQLAPIQSDKHIIQTIAEAVRFPLATQGNPQRQLLRFLKNRQTLLVMDNFEHLLGGVGIISEIIRSAPLVTIIATSRERLNLQGETIFNLSGMAYPDPDVETEFQGYDAITLFVQSARRVRPGFEPSIEELVQITRICQIVEGMPLAIELAAAWLHILNVDDVALELEKNLDILVTEMRDTPYRHHSIRAVFDHSWLLLSQYEKEIFKPLSVFRGGFTIEAAKQVTGASLQQLAEFVNKSFLSHEPDSGRLVIHELLRQYAQERLRENPSANVSAKEAHTSYYAAFTQQRWEDLKGNRQLEAIAEIEADIENIRAAWRYALAQKNVAQLWMFIHCLWHFHWIRWWNHAGMVLFADAVGALKDEDNGELLSIKALAMSFQAYFMVWLDFAEQGYELVKEGVAILERQDHPKSLVLAYDSLVLNAYFVRNHAEQVAVADRMLEISTKLDDKWLLAYSQFAASLSAIVIEDYQRAIELAEANLKLFEETENQIGSSLPLIVLGHAALARGDYPAALGFYERCLKISKETGFHYAIQTSSKYLSKVALSMGNLEDAENYLLRSLTISKEIDFVRDIINLLYEFARLQVAKGDLEEAVELLGLVISHPVSDQSRMLYGRIRDSARELLAELEDELPPEIFASTLERGRRSDLDEVVIHLIG